MALAEHQGGDIFMPAIDNRMGVAAAAMFGATAGLAALGPRGEGADTRWSSSRPARLPPQRRPAGTRVRSQAQSVR